MLQDFTAVLHGYWSQLLYMLPRLLLAAVVMGGVWVGAGRLRSWLAAKLSTHSDDPLLTDFLTQVGRWVLVLIGIAIALNIMGFTGVVSGILGAAGLSAFVVGFAFKDIAENFLAGIILAFNRPFGINDTVKIQDMFGQITKLNLRTTEMGTFDGRDISIPNAIVLKEPLVNYTRDGFIRQDFVVGVDYDDDVAAAIALILEQVRQEPEVLTDREPFAVIDELAASTVNLKVFFWTDTEDYRRATLELRSRVMNRVKKALMEGGYALPPDILELRLPNKMPAIPIQVAVAQPGTLADPPEDPKKPGINPTASPGASLGPS
ncbi:mechanosensitive ion channel family protein [Hymenobacter rubripertinctus]|uniref:Mechanosensitive ion channel family protein n=1 Tax=Hymenobacter rubripertinctus TaxID=2029981 RepID=A0A418QV91_9BACT|nr:mechanosensitive ion channel family protein [Hymenobacter rubripertinctus]RIY09068.1 mechanosensitive ion channel family protein [Hymenobacter rubripertinctus]